ncbi:CHAT domain-containing protein [Lactarius quietus]|nr:CHAT domain-containing protein [Lactarius quietus]
MANVLGSIDEIDSDITQYQDILSILSRSDPCRFLFLLELAKRREERFLLSNQREDLDKSICHFTESILLLPLWLLEPCPIFLGFFFFLASALLMRSKVYKQPDDAVYAAKYLFHLRIARLLVIALEMNLETVNVMQSIREIATPDIDATRLIYVITSIVGHNIYPGVPDQPLDELIECLRVAKKHKPDILQAHGHFAFAISLASRYFMTYVDDDYEEAMSMLDEIIDSSSPGDGQDEAKLVAEALEITSMLAVFRSTVYQDPEYLEEAMYRSRTLRNSTFLMNTLLGGREYLGMHDEMNILLLWIRNNDNTMKIDKALEKGRALLASYSPTDSATSVLQSTLSHLFGKILFEAFQCAKKIEYINESIIISSFPGYRAQDLDEALELFSQYVSDAHASLPERYRFECVWAYAARYTRHPSLPTAYKNALSLIQDVLHFSPTLPLQHTTLVTRDLNHRMPLDYVSYLADLHQLEEAIETLERGRALLWSEMRHLRIPIDQLLEADSDLGHQFAAVNRDLEELTKSIPPSLNLSMDDGSADSLRAVDPFGRLLLKQRKLLKERGDLISQIQALPGFGSFLKSPPFDTLRSAASSGPVIILNHSEWRSDIIILLHSTPPSLIPTPPDFYDRARALKERLLDSRDRHGLNSEAYDETLASVLAELYTLVGKPVIDRLRQLQVPEQSRIWWCPTSVFGSLPLHAMDKYFLDLYICSYTPTLSALIQSHNHDLGSRSSDRPAILLVAQPDTSLPTVESEIQFFQNLNTEVTSLISAAATPATVIEGFQHHRFVHFACHGTLEPRKPFEAGFELYEDERLTLLEIVRAHLTTAEFAFLSACHTAEVTEGSLMDEALHLAAAVQHCGFRSVVGTMWAMVDEDGQDLAENFYKALFSNSKRDKGIPYYERSAKALQSALRKLQRWVNFVHYGAE